MTKMSDTLLVVVGIILMLLARLVLPASLLAGIVGLAGLLLIIWVMWGYGMRQHWAWWKMAAAIATLAMLVFLLFP